MFLTPRKNSLTKGRRMLGCPGSQGGLRTIPSPGAFQDHHGPTTPPAEASLSSAPAPNRTAPYAKGGNVHRGPEAP